MSDYDELLRTLKCDCDNYRQTVQAIKAFAHEMLWDDAKRTLLAGARAYIGRRMQTSRANRISRDTDVTPDLVVLRSPQYGVIAEGKLTFAGDPELRAPRIREIQKYDDDLFGWDTADGRVPTHDVAMIVHHFHGREILSQITQMRSAGELAFYRKFALICFALVEQAEVWISLELLDGALSDGEKHQKLANRLPIGLDHVAANPLFAGVELYDAAPPAPLLMYLIHDVILSYLEPDENLRLREEGEVEKAIQVAQLRVWLSEEFGPGQEDARVPEIPRASWVRKAMELFAKLGWARKEKAGTGRYVYIVKRRRKPFEQFLKFCAGEQARREGRRQKHRKDRPLFPDWEPEQD